jgi:Cof subfamily protein (haloacid dehalogenase superfamily)
MRPRPYDALVLDVDGTLLDDSDRVHPRTRAALDGARAAGMQLMLATGRSAGGVRDVARELGLQLPAIVYNGAGVYCPIEDRVIESIALPEALVDTVLAHAAANALLPIVALPDGQQFSRPGRTVEERGVLTDFRSLAVRDEHDLPRRGALRVTLISERHADAADLHREVAPLLPAPAYMTYFALSMLPRFRDSLLQVIDIQPECDGKADALRILRERRGIPAERVVAVGDAGNDVPMLRAAGLGVAMGNATAEVKQLAHRVIGDNNSDALGGLIEELFL